MRLEGGGGRRVVNNFPEVSMWTLLLLLFYVYVMVMCKGLHKHKAANTKLVMKDKGYSSKL